VCGTTRETSCRGVLRSLFKIFFSLSLSRRERCSRTIYDNIIKLLLPAA
jgi:hypothetical protein